MGEHKKGDLLPNPFPFHANPSHLDYSKPLNWGAGLQSKRNHKITLPFAPAPTLCVHFFHLILITPRKVGTITPFCRQMN